MTLTGDPLGERCQFFQFRKLLLDVELRTGQVWRDVDGLQRHHTVLAHTRHEPSNVVVIGKFETELPQRRENVFERHLHVILSLLDFLKLPFPALRRLEEPPEEPRRQVAANARKHNSMALLTCLFPSSMGHERTLSDKEHEETVSDLAKEISALVLNTQMLLDRFNGFFLDVPKYGTERVSSSWSYERLIGPRWASERVKKSSMTNLPPDASIREGFGVCHDKLEAMKAAVKIEMRRVNDDDRTGIDADDVKWVDENVTLVVARGDVSRVEELVAGVRERCGRCSDALARMIAARAVQVAHVHAADALLALRDGVEPHFLVFERLRGVPREPLDDVAAAQGKERRKPRAASVRIHDDDSMRDRQRKEEWLLRLDAKVQKHSPLVKAILRNTRLVVALAAGAGRVLRGMDFETFKTQIDDYMNEWGRPIDPIHSEDDVATALASSADTFSIRRRRAAADESSELECYTPLLNQPSAPRSRPFPIFIAT